MKVLYLNRTSCGAVLPESMTGADVLYLQHQGAYIYLQTKIWAHNLQLPDPEM